MILLAGDAEFNNVILKPVPIISIDTWDSAGNSKHKLSSTYLLQFCESQGENYSCPKHNKGSSQIGQKHLDDLQDFYTLDFD